MKEVREYTVQTFDEFNEAEQKEILDNYRYINTDYCDWVSFDYYCDELQTRGFNVDARDIDYDLSCCQGSGASFRCDSMDVDKLLADLEIRHKKFWVAYIKRYNPHIVDRGNSRYSHEYTKDIALDEDCDIDWYEERHPKATKEFYKIIDYIDQKRLKACEWLYKALMDEMEYLESDEAVKDTIEANEYLFDTRTLKIA